MKYSTWLHLMLYLSLAHSFYAILFFVALVAMLYITYAYKTVLSIFSAITMQYRTVGHLWFYMVNKLLFFALIFPYHFYTIPTEFRGYNFRLLLEIHTNGNP